MWRRWKRQRRSSFAEATEDEERGVDGAAGEYVRGGAHTNTVEGFFSLLKGGVVGTFHSVSRQHLPLYLAGFNHRWNYRHDTDGQRTVAGLRKIEGKRLVYKFVD